MDIRVEKIFMVRFLWKRSDVLVYDVSNYVTTNLA